MYAQPHPSRYCTLIGKPCHHDWWYNHGPQQWAARETDLGYVTMPLGLFDPVSAVCVCPIRPARARASGEGVGKVA